MRCRHKETITLYNFKKNYPFGRKSRGRKKHKPYKETEMCTSCRKKLWSFKKTNHHIDF